MIDNKMRASNIEIALREGSVPQIFIYDGTGVHPVNDLLSEEQEQYIADVICVYMRGISEDLEAY